MTVLSTNAAWYALYATLKTTLEMGQEQHEIGSTFLKGSLAGDLEISKGFGLLVSALQKNPEFLEPFQQLPGTSKEKPLDVLLESYGDEHFGEHVKNTSIKEIRIANGIQLKAQQILAQSTDNQNIDLKESSSEEKKGADKKPDETRERITIKTKDGTEITIGGDGSTTKKKEEDGDDPRDVGKPSLYGEEIDPITGKYAISIHSVKCIEDELTEDDVVYKVSSKQEFKDFSEPIIVNFSSKVHDDIDENEIMSAIDDVRSPKDQGSTKLKIFKEDRCCLRFNKKANVDGVISKHEEVHTGFNLDKFERCIIEISLIDAGASFSEYLTKIIQFLEKIGSLGFDVLQVSTIDQIVNNLIGKPSKTGLKELAKWLEELLRASKTPLGEETFVISQSHFKSTIENATLTPSRYGFSWVKGVTVELPETNGAKYEVALRYEKLD